MEKLTLRPSDLRELRRLPEFFRQQVIAWLPIVNDARVFPGLREEAFVTIAAAHGVSIRALKDRYYLARRDGWRGLIKNRIDAQSGFSSLGVSIPEDEQGEYEALSDPLRREVDLWLPLVNQIGLPLIPSMHAVAAASSVSFCSLRDLFYRAKDRGWRGLIRQRLDCSSDGLLITIPAADRPRFLGLLEPVRRGVEFWLRCVNEVKPDGNGMHEAIGLVASRNGVSYGALRDWFYKARNEGWRGLIPARADYSKWAGASGLDIAVPPADAAAFEALTAPVRRGVEFWMAIVNDVRPDGAGVAAAIRSTADNHGVSYRSLKERFFGAKSRGWRALVYAYDANAKRGLASAMHAQLKGN